jgi:hypothetical protein
VAAAEAAQAKPAVSAAPPPVQKKEEPSFVEKLGKHGLSLAGYIQVQYGQNQQSKDELYPGGSPVNQNRFSVRRARLRVRGRWQYARTDLEIDGSNSRGPSMSLRRASISGVLPSSSRDQLPLLVVTAGLTEIPIGIELQQGQNEIMFLERTVSSLAFFPGPVDTGVKVESALGAFRIQLAAMNGTPLDDRAGGPSGQDFTKEVDLLGRVGADTRPLEWLHVAGGASFLTGKGFHPGSDATKGHVEWNDSNSNNLVDDGENVPVPGRGALPSQTFKHWSVNADLLVDVVTKLGLSRVYGEFALASNLDRALFVADPLVAGQDVRQVAWYVAAVQDVTRWGFVGARYDVYDPNSDLLDTRQGHAVPADSQIKTFSPIAGARWPGLGRLTFQYDLVSDHLARDRRGVPTDVKNNQWTVRAQGEF